MSVDVAINFYGKPWQTMLTIESLLEHSGAHIDVIYLTRELEQPHGGEEMTELVRRYSGRLIVFTPARYLGWRAVPLRGIRTDPDLRRSLRYQYALEETGKRHLFVTHNDVFYTGDLVGELLRVIDTGPHAGAGSIGQCWNCPACTAGLCDGDQQAQLELSWIPAMLLAHRVRSPRTRPWRIDPWHPTPLPECRLNEFACLLDVDMYRRDTIPWGSSPPFGYFGRVDIGCAWFRAMVLKGHTFANVPIEDYCIHRAGHPDLFDPGAYQSKEQDALALLTERYGVRIT
jgi:hypothetical protein